jgi:hypothetical protein
MSLTLRDWEDIELRPGVLERSIVHPNLRSDADLGTPHNIAQHRNASRFHPGHRVQRNPCTVHTIVPCYDRISRYIDGRPTRCSVCGIAAVVAG